MNGDNRALMEPNGVGDEVTELALTLLVTTNFLHGFSFCFLTGFFLLELSSNWQLGGP